MKPHSRFPLLQLAIVVAFFVLLLPASAFAQSVVPVTALTPYAVLVTVLTLALGALTTAKNTSTFLGKPIPANVMVWLLLVLPFVAGVTTTFVQAGSLTAVSAFNAIVAGLVAVTAGATPGAVVHLALHAHLQVPRIAASFRGPPPPSGNATTGPAKAAAAAVLLALGLGGVLGSQASCKALPTVENVAQVIIADFEAGKSQQQIEADACNALGGTSPEDVVCKDVAMIVVDVIDSAIAKGQLSPAAKARAEAYKSAHASK